MIKMYYIFVHTNGQNIRYLGKHWYCSTVYESKDIIDSFFATDINELRTLALTWAEDKLATGDRICIGCTNAEVDPFFPIEVVV